MKIANRHNFLMTKAMQMKLLLITVRETILKRKRTRNLRNQTNCNWTLRILMQHTEHKSQYSCMIKITTKLQVVVMMHFQLKFKVQRLIKVLCFISSNHSFHISSANAMKVGILITNNWLELVVAAASSCNLWC